MLRKSLLLLGLAMAILWWIGLSQDRGATVLWFNAVGAVLSFGCAGLVDEPDEQPSAAIVPALFGLAFGAVFAFSLARGQPAWATWLNLLFALCYLGVAVAATLRVRHQAHVHAHVRR
jgi:hypothetical protein